MTIQLFQPSLGREEIESVYSVMHSNWLGRGPVSAQFESAWAQHIGVAPAQCLAITSATEGLFTIFQMLLSPGDEVIIPAIHFVGVANAVVAAGGKPVFCDVDKRTLNTTAQFIADRITPKTRAVFVLHYGGYPCEIDDISILCGASGIYLIEDSANSPASSWMGKACGTWGDFGVWSFDAHKIISTGDGGMLYARNPDDIQTAKKMLYLGQDEMSGYSSTRERWWEFSVSVAGRRGLMNDLTAAIGLEQLCKLSDFVEWRRRYTLYYNKMFYEMFPKSRKVITPHNPLGYHENDGCSYYFYPIQLENQETRDGLARYLRSKDIYVSMRYFPLHRVEFFAHDGYLLPGAEYAADRTLLLPMHQSLSFEDVETVCKRVKEYFEI